MVTTTLPTVICLMGPTASGKTAIAVELARRFPVSIISVDSALVYCGMDIGTAKPEKEILLEAPHQLIDFLDPAQSYSAAQFSIDATREIELALAAGRIPLLVGGTMLYFRALQQGLADMPSSDAAVRAQLEADAKALGGVAMHARLQEIDPEAAARIHPNDPQRIQRALEVYLVSGRSLSDWIRSAQANPSPYRWVNLVIAPSDRDLLRTRIADRFQLMLAQGFVDEVVELRARGDLDLDKPSMRAVGYRQIWEYLDGLCDEATMIERGIIATRQLAKRQFTWLRAYATDAWFDSGLPCCVLEVIAYIERILADDRKRPTDH